MTIHRTKHNGRVVSAILLVLALCTLFQYAGGIPKAKAVSAKDYKKAGIEMALSTAYSDGSIVSNDEGDDKGDAKQTFYNNLRSLLQRNGRSIYGNVGLLVGPRTSNENLSDWAVANQTSSMSKDQMDALSKEFPEIKQYHAFGKAVARLKDKGSAASTTGVGLEASLDAITQMASGFSNFGIKLLNRYNPGPVILGFYDASKLENAAYANNKLMQTVHRLPALKEIILTFGSPSTLIPGAPVSFVIMGIIVIFLCVTALLMTIFNGRAAGENFRKGMVRVIVASVGIPIVAWCLTKGVDFLQEEAAKEAKEVGDPVISQHLNLADWYATGFAIPDGVTLPITEDGYFEMTPETVKAINQFTYRQVTGEEPDNKKMAKRITTAARESVGMGRTNLFTPAFLSPTNAKTGTDWKVDKIWKAAEALGSNDSTKTVADALGSETVGYLDTNRNTMTGAGNGGYAVTAVNQARFGISPIAARNLMRTKFDKNGMTVSGGVMDTCAIVPNAPNTYTEIEGKGIPSLIRFIATMLLLVAGGKGIAHIFYHGIGGLLTGSAGAAVGRTANMGRAVGGMIALVAGVFGVGMLITFAGGLMDEVYLLVNELFSAGKSDASLLEPLRDTLNTIPVVGGILGGLANTFPSLIINGFALVLLPKFATYPVDAFCAKLCQLPDALAEKFQAAENRFTGDYRAQASFFGRGGGAGGGTSFGRMGQEMKGQALAALAGAGAIAGYAASKAGGALVNTFGDKDGSGGMSLSDGFPDGPDGSPDGSPDGGSDGYPDTSPDGGSDTTFADADGTSVADGQDTGTSDGTSGENQVEEAVDPATGEVTGDTAGAVGDVGEGASVSEDGTAGVDASVADTNADALSTDADALGASVASTDTNVPGADTDVSAAVQDDKASMAAEDGTTSEQTGGKETVGKPQTTPDGKSISSDHTAKSKTGASGKTTAQTAEPKNQTAGSNTDKVQPKVSDHPVQTPQSLAGRVAGKATKSSDDILSALTRKDQTGTTKRAADKAKAGTRKTAHAIGKGLQAAGGGTTGAEAAAGALHILGAAGNIHGATAKPLSKLQRARTGQAQAEARRSSPDPRQQQREEARQYEADRRKQELEIQMAEEYADD